jgi:hypothetical protein
MVSLRLKMVQWRWRHIKIMTKVSLWRWMENHKSQVWCPMTLSSVIISTEATKRQKDRFSLRLVMWFLKDLLWRLRTVTSRPQRFSLLTLWLKKFRTLVDSVLIMERNADLSQTSVISQDVLITKNQTHGLISTTGSNGM